MIVLPSEKAEKKIRPQARVRIWGRMQPDNRHDRTRRQPRTTDIFDPNIFRAANPRLQESFGCWCHPPGLVFCFVFAFFLLSFFCLFVFVLFWGLSALEHVRWKKKKKKKKKEE